MTESPVGSEYARARDIVVASAVLLVFTAVLVVVLVQAWPSAPGVGPDGRVRPEPETVAVHLPGWTPRLTREASLFVVVMAAGALGAIVHALRSLYWYVGNRALRRSWLMMYLFLPFVGALLGLVVYLVLRGGLTSPVGGSAEINPYGVTAIAALVGLFSQQTAEKLRTVFATLFAPAEPGRDQALQPGRDQVYRPWITRIEPASGPVGTLVTVHGTSLGAATFVRFGDVDAAAADVTDTRLRVRVPEGATTGSVVVHTTAGPAAAPGTFTVG
ncbi:IPT/TIG domain-containing protein [Actinomadura terrae]|uniref:IPT/TIG domain-containing protein n=1 Tax=Actinomadura terrae TaxID=604353 RepID=UPI001FA7CBBE|nr:IPT/TIG domain-containing protein [Actinomadura terrae]